MSDSFQSLAFPDVKQADAEDLASRLLESLVSRGILEPDPNPECALDEEGYSPGKDIGSALSDQRAGGQLLTLKTNGVVISAEPTVFSGDEPPETTTCPKCNHSFDGGEDFGGEGFGGEGSDGGEDFVELIGEWFEGEETTLDCPDCGEASPLEQVETTPPWALAHVGVKFWNWPVLSEQFVGSLVALVGSRAVLVTGKI